MGFTVYDIRDLDLMLRLQDLTSVTAKDLAGEMGVNGDSDGHVIAARLAWMRRYGMLDLTPKSREWSLSEGGRRVTSAQLRAAAKSQIESVPDEEMVEVMAHVTSRVRLGDRMTAAMLRREFQYGSRVR
jgi:hypothetical protein